MDNFTEKTLRILQGFKDINKKYCLEKSKDNKYIIRINKEGKNIYLGSKYNVKRDIDKFLEELDDINSSSIIVVFGLGSGEHIKKLLSKLEENNKVLIVEPDINVLNKFLEVEYAESIINDDRIALCLHKKSIIRNLFSYNIDATSVKNNIIIKVFCNYDKIYSKEFLQAFNELKLTIQNSLMDNATTKHFSETFTKAFISNLNHIVKSTPINFFKNKLDGKPAIVVSAGPSLEKNVYQLKEVQDNFIIITGARSLGTLIKNNIIPDFICMVDPIQFNCRFIEDYLEYKIPLVFYENTSYHAMNLHKGSKVLFSGNPLTSIILEYNVDSLMVGGSVAHTCASFAAYMGCSPITFIGQDFAYTEEKIHADSSVFKEENKIDDKIDFIEVKDVFGNLVKTDRRLNTYRINMEGIVENYKDIKFINSTEGGANMKGTKVQSLSKTIGEYGKEKIEKENISRILSNPSIAKKDVIIEYLEKSEKILKEIYKKSERALDYSNNMYVSFTQNKNININKTNEKLDEIDDYIKKNRERVLLINSLLFEVIENVLCNPSYMLSSKDSEREKGIKISKKSRALYKGIREKTKEFMPILKEGIRSLKEDM